MVLEAEEIEVGQDHAKMFRNVDTRIRVVEFRSSVILCLEVACSIHMW
jgi:hypothetical protein